MQNNATQIQHPWRATIRTVAATVVAVVVALAAALPVVEQAMGTYIPDRGRAALLWLGGLMAALSGLVTRLMALPEIDALLGRIGLSAEPRV